MAEAPVWYAGYGSNLRRERLAAYLEGGTPPGSTRRHTGARDPRPPLDAVTCTLPGTIAFRGRFSSWGDGGAAFWEERDDGSRTWCRAYLVRRPQLLDLVLQENGLAPSAVDPARLSRLARDLDAVVDAAPASSVLLDPAVHPYALLASRRAGEVAGPTVVTVTAPAEARRTRRAPPVAYAATILAGLTVDVGLSAAEARAYLVGVGAPAEVVDRALSVSHR